MAHRCSRCRGKAKVSAETVTAVSCEELLNTLDAHITTAEQEVVVPGKHNTQVDFFVVQHTQHWSGSEDQCNCRQHPECHRQAFFHQRQPTCRAGSIFPM